MGRTEVAQGAAPAPYPSSLVFDGGTVSLRKVVARHQEESTLKRKQYHGRPGIGMSGQYARMQQIIPGSNAVMVACVER